eukprot:2025533-Amphidinium_carterae.1
MSLHCLVHAPLCWVPELMTSSKRLKADGKASPSVYVNIKLGGLLGTTTTTTTTTLCGVLLCGATLAQTLPSEHRKSDCMSMRTKAVSAREMGKGLSAQDDTIAVPVADTHTHSHKYTTKANQFSVFCGLTVLHVALFLQHVGDAKLLSNIRAASV